MLNKLEKIDNQKDLYNELLNEMATQTKDNTNNE